MRTDTGPSGQEESNTAEDEEAEVEVEAEMEEEEADKDKVEESVGKEDEDVSKE